VYLSKELPRLELARKLVDVVFIIAAKKEKKAIVADGARQAKAAKAILKKENQLKRKVKGHANYIFLQEAKKQYLSEERPPSPEY
jgi:hypothetical protein